MHNVVILAGGKSERLRGIVPPYHKPFLVVNGKSLLVAAVDVALELGAGKVIVVATGENALPVWQLVGHHDKVRVILSDTGVGDSLARGLELSKTYKTMVMLGDNVHDVGELADFARDEHAIGVTEVDYPDATRFTRLVDDEWYEGRVTFKEDDLTSATVWCGPLVVDTHKGQHYLRGQQRIGAFLPRIAPNATHIKVSSVDVGVPSALVGLTVGGPRD